MASQYTWMLWCDVFNLGSAAASRQQAETRPIWPGAAQNDLVQLRRKTIKNLFDPCPLEVMERLHGKPPDSRQFEKISPRKLCVLRSTFYLLGNESGAFSRPQTCEGALSRWLTQVLVFSFQVDVWPVWFSKPGSCKPGCWKKNTHLESALPTKEKEKDGERFILEIGHILVR